MAHHGEEARLVFVVVTQKLVRALELDALTLEHVVGVGELRGAIVHLRLQVLVEPGQLVRHVVEFRGQRVHLERRLRAVKAHVQIARLYARHAFANLSQGVCDQMGKREIHDEQARNQHDDKEHHVLENTVLLCGDVQIHGDDDADGSADIVYRPSLFGMPRHIYLALRLAVALQTRSLYLHGSQIAKHLLPVILGHRVILRQARISAKRVEGFGLELIGRVFGIARIEIDEPRQISRFVGKELSDGTPRNRAMQALVRAVFRKRRRLKPVLVRRHEIPNSRHLLREDEALLSQLIDGLLALGIRGPRHASDERDHEQHHYQHRKLGLELDVVDVHIPLLEPPTNSAR